MNGPVDKCMFNSLCVVMVQIILQAYFYEKDDCKGKIGNQIYDGASKWLKSIDIIYLFLKNYALFDFLWLFTKVWPGLITKVP